MPMAPTPSKAAHNSGAGAYQHETSFFPPAPPNSVPSLILERSPPPTLAPSAYCLADHVVVGECDASCKDGGSHGHVEAQVQQHVPALPGHMDGAAVETVFN